MAAQQESLKGFRSNKLRNLMIYVNGIAGVNKVRHLGHTVGLHFDCELSACTLGDLEWALDQAQWLRVAHRSAATPGSVAVEVEAGCTLYGKLTGTLELYTNTEGVRVLAARLRALKEDV